MPWDDANGWPPEADGAGYSLVRRSLTLAPSDPAGWRVSLDPNGEGCGPAPLFFSAWQALYFAGGVPSAAGNADPDRDGFSNALEYAAATNPNRPDSGAQPVARRFTSAGQPCVGITIRHRPATPMWLLESSTNLTTWKPSGAAPSIAPNDDGSESVTFCLPQTQVRTCYRATAVIP